MLLQVLFPSRKYSLRILEYPQWLSRLKPQGLGQPPASRQECPLCPKPSTCLTMLEYPRLSLDLHLPFHPSSATPGNWSPIRDFFCPYAHSTALKAWNPPQPPFCFGLHPPGSYSGCGPLPLPLLAGLVAADAVVSLLIVVVVFMCASPRGRPTQGEGRAWTGGGVPREEVPMEGSPGGSPGGAAGETLGALLGELLRKPLKQEVPGEVEMWVGGGWSGLMLSFPHPQKMARSTSTCLAGADPL